MQQCSYFYKPGGSAGFDLARSFLPLGNLENLDYLGVHFTRFYCRERRSKSPTLDLSKN